MISWSQSLLSFKFHLCRYAALVVFGGWAGGNQFLNDTWALDVDTLTWRAVSTRGAKPRPRAGHTAVAFGRQLVVFGGSGAGSTYGELWVLDMDTRWGLYKFANPVDP